MSAAWFIWPTPWREYQVVRVIRVAEQAEEVVDETTLVAVDQVAEAFPISLQDR